ncbi:hypothetical protein [Actinocrispum wychmicini]|uniref:Uncharacterized protein n=1 Tax=Actinocrispum wychmicini TaxID=1213861 RepID=A0A4V2S8S1_9PSEU|nr:hypothetical protein [Actinocrispum wychmicini]TCO64960.1 hypothetical protein EV192_101744 [Actinocrispum wychmicini]
MARTMYDSVNWKAIPATAAIVAGYLPPSPYAWPAEAWERFPDAVKVRIAVRAYTDAGHVLDVEKGDATPDEAPDWVTMRRAAGADPTVYCSASQWPIVRAAFAAARVAEPHWWPAKYDGVAVIPAGAVAKQYANPPGSGGQYDLSIVADHWPGVDEGEDMAAVTEETQSYKDMVARVGALAHAQERAGSEAILMVTLLLDACFRIEALLKGTDQEGGPSKGTANQLTVSLANIQTKISTLSAGLTADQVRQIFREELGKHIQITGDIKIGGA